MLARNDIFTFSGGSERFRLLAIFIVYDEAWILSLDNAKAWPKRAIWSALFEHASSGRVKLVKDSSVVEMREPSPIGAIRRDLAWERLEGLVLESDPTGTSLVTAQPRRAIFISKDRSRLVKEHAKSVGCATATLYRDLRRYLEGGQTRNALCHRFDRCGHSSVAVLGVSPLSGTGTPEEDALSLTAKRGRPSKDAGRPIYQVTRAEERAIVRFFRTHYLRKEMATLKSAYQRLREEHYSYQDGNGERFLRPAGECPSLRQFISISRKHIPLAKSLQEKHGNVTFEQSLRATTGSVLDHCAGIGHIYEIDATVVDVFLVSSEDPALIVGKPTFVMVIDTRSKLVVGFYVGYERDSWPASHAAILSIFEDKEALCKKYDVPYHPSDWPADRIAPLNFVADRGPMISEPSSLVVGGLSVAVKNLPTARADWKPTVECGFKQIHRPLLEADGYEPPQQHMRRRGKKYAKDATMNLHQFTRHLLLAIIRHNRTPRNTEILTLTQLGKGMLPIPTHIWADEAVTRMGQLPRIPEHEARRSLLRRGQALVTRDGIQFKGCAYTCARAVSDDWFVRARQATFYVEVAWDQRRCQSIEVKLPEKYGTYEVATLTPFYQRYANMSFAEKIHYQEMERRAGVLGAEVTAQETYAFHQQVDAPQAKARAIATAARKGKSFQSRISNKAALRERELKRERAENVQVGSSPPKKNLKKAEVVILGSGNRRPDQGTDPGAGAGSPEELSIQERFARAHKEMLNGNN